MGNLEAQVVEEYNIPKIGIVSILKRNGEYFINTPGYKKQLTCQNPTSLKETREFVSISLYIQTHPQKNISSAFLEQFQQDVITGEDWITQYRVK